MLTRGIPSAYPDQGPGSLLGQAQKRREDQENQVDLFNQNMSNLNANSLSLGKKHLGVVNEYVQGIEKMMDMYAQKPSSDLKRAIANQMTMANSYITKATTLQNVNNTNLSNLLADPTAYIDSIEDATQKYNEIHAVPYDNLQFDPEKGVLMFDEEGNAQSVFQDKYLAGSDALVFMKRGLMEEVDPIGTFANDKYNLFADVSKDELQGKVTESIVAGATTSPELQQRAVIHWLQNNKMLAAYENEQDLAMAVSRLLSDKKATNEAVQWYAGEEAKRMAELRASKEAEELAKNAKTMDDFYGGYYKPEGDLSISMIEAKQSEGMDVFPKIEGIDWNTASDELKAEGLRRTVGFDMLHVFDEPLTHADAPNILSDDESIVAHNIGADGKMYILKETIETEDGGFFSDDITGIKQEVMVLDPSSAEYRTIIDYRISPEMETALLERSMERSAEEQKARVLNRRDIAVQKQKEREEAARQQQTQNQDTGDNAGGSLFEEEPTNPAVLPTPDTDDIAVSMIDDGGPLDPSRNEVFLDRMHSDSGNVWDDNIFTRYNPKSKHPYLFNVTKALLDQGYNEGQIADVLKSPSFQTAVEKEGLASKKGLFNRVVSNAIDVVAPDGLYKSGYKKQIEGITKIAAGMIDGGAISQDSQSTEKVNVEVPKTQGEAEVIQMGMTLPVQSEEEVQQRVLDIQESHAAVIDSLRAAEPLEMAPMDELTDVAIETIRQDPSVLENPISYVLRNNQIGLDETNVDHQRTIAGFFKNANASAVGNKNVVQNPSYVTLDSFAWCGAFADSVLTGMKAERLGEDNPYNRIRAKKYLDLGSEVQPQAAKPGDIVVIKTDEGHHVGFFVETRGDSMYILGGNQNDMVNISPFNITSVQGVRRLDNVGALSQKERDLAAQLILEADENVSTTR